MFITIIIMHDVHHNNHQKNHYDFPTSGVATLGFDPPITPGLMLPVSWYLFNHHRDDDDYHDTVEDDNDNDRSPVEDL